MTKLTMQEVLARIRRDQKVSLILVTHNWREAIYFADRMLMITKETGTAPVLIVINLPRPRSRSEDRFVAMRRRLMAEFGLHWESPRQQTEQDSDGSNWLSRSPIDFCRYCSDSVEAMKTYERRATAQAKHPWF